MRRHRLTLWLSGKSVTDNSLTSGNKHRAEADQWEASILSRDVLGEESIVGRFNPFIGVHTSFTLVKHNTFVCFSFFCIINGLLYFCHLNIKCI